MAFRRLYSSNVLVLGAVSFIESLAFSIPFSYFPNYALSLGASVASLGLFTSSFMAASALLSPKIGTISDRIGRKKLMIWGLLGDIVFGALTGLVPSWYWLLVVRAINGAVTALATLPAEALLIDQVPVDKRGEAVGFVASCGIIGRNVGPIFGGTTQFLAMQFMDVVSSYRVPYFVDAAFAVFAVILVAWKIDERSPGLASRDAENVSSSDKLGQPLNKKDPVKFSRSYKILLACAFANGIALGFILPLIPLFFQDKFNIQPIAIGTIMTIAGLTGFIASWLAGRISDKIGRKPFIALGGYSTRLCGLILPFTGSVEQAIFFLSFRSLGFNIFMPALQALRADIVPKEFRGKLFGIYNTFFNVGDIVGPVLSTFLYDIYRSTTWNVSGFMIPGIGMPFFVNSILGIVTTTVLLMFVKETVEVKSIVRKKPTGKNVPQQLPV